MAERKTRDNYVEMGLIQNPPQTFIGDDDGNAPRSVYETTRWKCTRCGRDNKFNYHKLQQGETRCRCAGVRSKSEQDYLELAEKLGIKWIGQSLPLTTTTETEWKAANGETFTADYNSLIRSKVPVKLREYLSA